VKLLFDENVSPHLVTSGSTPGTTADIEALLRSNRTEILAFGTDGAAAFLALS
jgi:hypothetical protein